MSSFYLDTPIFHILVCCLNFVHTDIIYNTKQGVWIIINILCSIIYFKLIYIYLVSVCVHACVHKHVITHAIAHIQRSQVNLQELVCFVLHIFTWDQTQVIKVEVILHLIYSLLHSDRFIVYCLFYML